MARRLIAALAVAVLFAACGGTEATTTTTATTVPSTGTTIVQGSLIFGEGTLPETVPAAFPIPDGANIGATLQDADTGRTEVLVIFPAEAGAVVDYFEQNLPTAGFEIVRSEEEGISHVIELTGQGITGELRIGAGESNAATGVLVLTPAG